MATTKDAANYVLTKLGHPGRFEAKAMFGEFGLYADGRFVGAICDGQLYVKKLAASAVLEGRCDQDSPYPGAKPHYLVEESQLMTLHELPAVLFAMAVELTGKGSRSSPKRNAGKGRPGSRETQ